MFRLDIAAPPRAIKKPPARKEEPASAAPPAPPAIEPAAIVSAVTVAQPGRKRFRAVIERTMRQSAIVEFEADETADMWAIAEEVVKHVPDDAWTNNGEWGAYLNRVEDAPAAANSDAGAGKSSPRAARASKSDAGDDYLASVAAAASIDILAELLNEFDPSLFDDEGRTRLEDVVDLASLPTFGGSEPSDTSGIYSWDDEYLLVYDGTWTLQERDDVAGKASARRRSMKSIDDFPGVAFYRDDLAAWIGDFESQRVKAVVGINGWVRSAEEDLAGLVADPDFTSEYAGLSPEVNGGVIDELTSLIDEARAFLASLQQ